MWGRDEQLNYANYIDATTGAFDATGFTTDVSAPSRTLLGANTAAMVAGAVVDNKCNMECAGPTGVNGAHDVTCSHRDTAIEYS